MDKKKSVRIKCEKMEIVFDFPKDYQTYKEECQMQLKIDSNDFNLYTNLYKDENGYFVVLNSTYDYDLIEHILKETNQKEIIIKIKKGKKGIENTINSQIQIDENEDESVNDNGRKKEKSNDYKEEDKSNENKNELIYMLKKNKNLQLNNEEGKNDNNNEIHNNVISRQNSLTFEGNIKTEIINNIPNNHEKEIDRMKNEIENLMKKSYSKLLKQNELQHQALLQEMKNEFETKTKELIQSVQTSIGREFKRHGKYINQSQMVNTLTENQPINLTKAEEVNNNQTKEISDNINKLITSNETKKKEIDKLTKRLTSIYQGVKCDKCGINPIIGIRYKCTECSDFNLCEECEELNFESNEHPHEFIKKKCYDIDLPIINNSLFNDNNSIIEINNLYNTNQSLIKEDNNYSQTILLNNYSIHEESQNSLYNFQLIDYKPKEFNMSVLDHFIINIVFRNPKGLQWKEESYLIGKKEKNTIIQDIQLKLKPLNVEQLDSLSLEFNNCSSLKAGDYTFVYDFIVEKTKYGEINLPIKIIDDITELIQKMREKYTLSQENYSNERLKIALIKKNKVIKKAFESLFK